MLDIKRVKSARLRERQFRVLLSGFNPFGDLSVNTSQLIVEVLQTRQLPGIAVESCVLTTSYSQAPVTLLEQLQPQRQWPDVIVMMGVAASATALRLERLAKNQRSTHLADNDGVVPTAPLIDPHGPTTLAATVDLSRLGASLSSAGVRASFSDDCGDFVCNFLYYQILDFLQRRELPIPALFVHVPSVAGEKSNQQLNALIADSERLLMALREQLMR